MNTQTSLIAKRRLRLAAGAVPARFASMTLLSTGNGRRQCRTTVTGTRTGLREQSS